MILKFLILIDLSEKVKMLIYNNIDNRLIRIIRLHIILIEILKKGLILKGEKL